MLIVAVPVGPKETLNRLKNEADFVESFMTPELSKFTTVGEYYQSFNPVTDGEVKDILDKRRL